MPLLKVIFALNMLGSMASISCTETCNSTCRMPLIHCKYPSQANQNVCYPLLRVTLFCSQASLYMLHSTARAKFCYHRENTLASSGQRAHYRQYGTLQMPLSSYLCCREMQRGLNRQIQQTAPTEEMVPVKNPV